MKSDFSTFERRIQIIAILINQNIVSRLDLARWFSVSDDAICRDIVAISRIVPISRKMGRYGGVYIGGNLKKEKPILRWRRKRC